MSVCLRRLTGSLCPSVGGRLTGSLCLSVGGSGFSSSVCLSVPEGTVGVDSFLCQFEDKELMFPPL